MPSGPTMREKGKERVKREEMPLGRARVAKEDEERAHTREVVSYVATSDIGRRSARKIQGKGSG